MAGFIMGADGFSTAQTRERVLESACELFAERGYRDATVKEICDNADANVAAVNYYFGSKEKLYAEAWRRAFQQSQENHPPDGGVPSDAPAREQLRGRIRALVHQVADEDNQAFQIAHREMAEPTGLLREVKRQCLKPLRESMKKLIRELVGPEAPEKSVHFCEASVAGQCFGVVRHARRGKACGPTPPALQEVERNVDAYAEHVFRFSMAGIQAIRDRIEAQDDSEDMT
jgi:AcrR family transcriptional regulator